jgi:glycosyltransferase involved in cell wall biosynthesis
MRVLLLTPTLGVGGAELLTTTWAAGLKDRGHTAAVAYGRWDARRPLLDRHEIEAFRVSDRGPTLASLLEWQRAVRGVIGRFGPDVIHAQSITTALIATLAGPRLPLLVTVHGIDEGDQRLAALILRGTGARVTAVSRDSAFGITRRLLAPAVEVLAPGIDVDAVVEAAAAPIAHDRSTPPRYCCVARHDRAKGVDVLLRAFPDVRAAIPDATLTLVGGGDELEPNRRLAAGLGLGDAISFVGVVANSAPYIRRADVIVLPSRREGLPIVALESLALGRPLVATAVGGTPSVVRDGQTGWLVPPEDPVALAGAMIEAGRDAREAGARADAGRALVRESFTSAKTLDRIERLLGGCAEQGAKRYLRRSPRRTPVTRADTLV